MDSTTMLQMLVYFIVILVVSCYINSSFTFFLTKILFASFAGKT